ncbi:unnamed protein product [Symbiodinium sp. CCMP2592]|nr:unnamed protein product [Symbiodinium sp. CCMP2592]
MACLSDFCEAGRGKASRVQHCNVFWPEALQTRAAELRRKVRDEQQKQAPNFTCCQYHLCVPGQEVAHRKASLVEDEVAQLRAEALQLQLAADKQRQERKAQREAKVDVVSLKKEVNRRQNQVLILAEELARMQADVRSLVAEAVRQAEKAASAREADIEQQWSTRVEVEQDKFRHETGRSRLRSTTVHNKFTIHCFSPRQAEQATLSLEQESACLEHEMRALPPRAAAVQLFAVLDELRHVRQAVLHGIYLLPQPGAGMARAARVHAQVAERMQTFRREEARLCEKDQKLAQLDDEAAEQRCKAAERWASFEEEARREEQELLERLERNRKRAPAPYTTRRLKPMSVSLPDATGNELSGKLRDISRFGPEQALARQLPSSLPLVSCMCRGSVPCWCGGSTWVS